MEISSRPSTNGQRLPLTSNTHPENVEVDSAISASRFEEQFDEGMLRTLDIDTWRLGNDMNKEYARIAHEVREAEKLESAQERKIRENFFPRLAKLPNMPKNAGKHIADRDEMVSIHRGLLFNGGVEACDGMVHIHDTLALTIYQIGISLASYRGDQGQWGLRLFRRDLRQKGADVDEWLQFLERRAKRDSSTRMPGHDQLGELVQKALLDYAERAILLRRSKAKWLMGHGNPITYELLTGGGNLELMVEGTKVLRELVEKHQKFVFVAGEPHERLLMTIGRALRPLEYAIIGTLDDRLENWLHQERFKFGVSKELMWDEESLSPTEWIPRVIERIASKIVVGLFRPTLMAPGLLFYAHVDHSEVAAHIALADSMLNERGTSMLLEMAQRQCGAAFGESLDALAESAYAAAGVNNRFLNERSHRTR